MKLFITLFAIWIGYTYSYETVYTTSVQMTELNFFSVQRNYDPKLHPFEAPREYVRALNATKLERVFAKPFIGALDGHRDGVNCLCKHPTSLSFLLSGACDGEVTLLF